MSDPHIGQSGQYEIIDGERVPIRPEAQAEPNPPAFEPLPEPELETVAESVTATKAAKPKPKR